MAAIQPRKTPQADRTESEINRGKGRACTHGLDHGPRQNNTRPSVRGSRPKGTRAKPNTRGFLLVCGDPCAGVCRVLWTTPAQLSAEGEGGHISARLRRDFLWVRVVFYSKIAVLLNGLGRPTQLGRATRLCAVNAAPTTSDQRPTFCLCVCAAWWAGVLLSPKATSAAVRAAVRKKGGGRFDKKEMRLAPPWPFDAEKMRTSWRVFGRSLNHAAARFAIASAAAWPSRWSEPHQNHHYGHSSAPVLAQCYSDSLVIGIATETHGNGWQACGRGATRSVQADDQFHDSRCETRDATMAKSPETPRRAVSLLECPGNLRGANATLDDDGLGVEIGAKLFRGMATRDHPLYRCVWC